MREDETVHRCPLVWIRPEEDEIIQSEQVLFFYSVLYDIACGGALFIHAYAKV